MPSLSDIVDEPDDEYDDAEAMTAAQVLAKLEQVHIVIPHGNTVNQSPRRLVTSNSPISSSDNKCCAC